MSRPAHLPSHFCTPLYPSTKHYLNINSTRDHFMWIFYQEHISTLRDFTLHLPPVCSLVPKSTAFIFIFIYLMMLKSILIMLLCFGPPLFMEVSAPLSQVLYLKLSDQILTLISSTQRNFLLCSPAALAFLPLQGPHIHQIVTSF